MIRGIITRLANTSGVTSLVPAASIYPVVAEQKVDRPYITVKRIVVAPQLMKGAASNTDQTTVQVTIHADSYKESIDISYAVRAALDNVGNIEIQGVKFKSIWYENSQDGYDSDDRTFMIADVYVARWSRL